MSEEEIKAIKELKHYGNMTSYYKEREYTDIQIGKYINIVLNLIDKQQKEIEKLKQITQNYNAIGGETFGDDRIIVCSMEYFDDGIFKRNFIWKDKIKEKIKELEEEIEKEEEETFGKCITIDKWRAIQVLQELLEVGDRK